MTISAVSLLILLLAGPRLQFLDFHAVGVIVAALVFLVSVASRGNAPRWLLVFMVALLPAGIYGGGVLLFAPYNSFEFIYICVVTFLYVLSVGGLVSVYQLAFREIWVLQIIKHTIIVWAAVAITAILFMFQADYRTFVGEYWEMNNNAHWAITGYRAYDIVSGGGFNGAFGYVMITFVALIYGTQSGLSKSVVWACCMLFMLAGLLMARSYLVLLVVGGLGAGFLLVVRSLMTGRIVIVGRHFRLIIVSVALAAVVIFGLLEVLPGNARDWAFEFVGPGGALQEVGSVRAIVEHMYFLPEGERALIFGEGYLGRWEGFPYISSDVGYVRIVYGVGIIGSILLWGPFVALLVISSGEFIYRACSVSLLAFIFSLVFLAGNFKEFTTFPRAAGVLCLLVIALYLSKNEKSGWREISQKNCV